MIKQATLVDASVIEDILLDALKWMVNNNLENQWNELNIKWNYLSKSYNISDFYIYYIEDQPVGCVAITDYDETYWPDIPRGTSLFIHKLAVKRGFAGRGISAELIDYTKQVARRRHIHSIRLDCNKDRIKLRNIYEKQGFTCQKEICTGEGYGLALYIYAVQS